MAKEIPVGDYFITKKIGRGSFSNVYKAYHKDTKEVYALKIIDISNLSEKILESLNNEIKILIDIDHPHIVKLHESVRSSNYIYLVLDYCEQGDLYKHIKTNGKLGENEAKKFYIQVAKGLYFLWIKNLIHRDLKPHNLLISADGSLKIADFGFARHLEEQKMVETLCGSPIYMAPEILKNRKYDSKVDLWSMGVILYELLIGNPPFTGRNHIELLNNILTTNFKIPRDVSITKNCIDLLGSLLITDPGSRISFKKFFEHPFFDGYDFKTSVNILSITENYILGEVPFVLRKTADLIMEENEYESEEEIYKMDDVVTFENYILITKKDKTSYLYNSTNKLIESILSIQIYVESIYKSASEIAFYGELKEEYKHYYDSQVLYSKTLNLYEHAIEVCNNTLKFIKESEQYLIPIKEFIIERFSHTLEKAENNHKKILTDKKFRQIVGVPVEKMIYDYALIKTKDGAIEETLDGKMNALFHYTVAVRLFDSLTMDKKPLDEHDKGIINGFRDKIMNRIEHIQKLLKNN